MLRLYKPLENHIIFKLHDILEHLVCNVWCEACDDDCGSKIHPEFKNIYDSYDWLKKEIENIYQICKDLNQKEKNDIIVAFSKNNQIEKLCNGEVDPVHLKDLPKVVKERMKDLLVDFYEILLERKKVPGTKQAYYKELIDKNEFQYCPCCGYMIFESTDSDYREAFDHYLPKSKYPFVSINFDNLVPLCNKCNSDRKNSKDPIENRSKAFYPFSKMEHEIIIEISFNKAKDLRKLKRSDLKINLIGDKDKIETWDRLFGINERYNDLTRSFLKTFLKRIKRRHNEFSIGKDSWNYIDTLNALIVDYRHDKYEDVKFLKIPLMEELKKQTYLVDIYGS